MKKSLIEIIYLFFYLRDGGTATAAAIPGPEAAVPDGATVEPAVSDRAAL